jgi:hypothetical protein
MDEFSPAMKVLRSRLRQTLEQCSNLQLSELEERELVVEALIEALLTPEPPTPPGGANHGGTVRYH